METDPVVPFGHWGLGLLGVIIITLACLKIKRCVDWTFKHALGTQALRYYIMASP
jgi:hypothetical protein